MDSRTFPGSRGEVAAATPDERVLGKLATSFVARLPLGLREMRAVLASDGCPVECRELNDLVRYYRVRGARAPFQIVRFGGMEVAVAPGQAPLAARLGAAAVRMVQHWGIVSRSALVERTESLSRTIVPETFVERILSALPATLWLDDSKKEWFSFPGRKTGLGEALDKVFALDRIVSVSELHAAVAKDSPAVTEAPEHIFARYLIDAAGCALDEGRVRRPAQPLGPALSVPEETLVALLRSAGGQLSPSSLRRRATEAGLADATLTRLLRFSPLVTRAANDEIKLLGTEATERREDAPSLEALGRVRSKRAAGFRLAS